MDNEDYWNNTEVKAFSFDDVDSSIIIPNKPSATQSDESSKLKSSSKTIGSILAARTEGPFLKPSIVTCDSKKVDNLIEQLYHEATIETVSKSYLDPKAYMTEIVEKKASIDFSPYKSKREKLILLDCAICYHDGNAITATTIFMSKTLKQSIFIEELKKRPMAINHYLSYLQMTGRKREFQELEKVFSRHRN